MTLAVVSAAAAALFGGWATSSGSVELIGGVSWAAFAALCMLAGIGLYAVLAWAFGPF